MLICIQYWPKCTASLLFQNRPAERMNTTSPAILWACSQNFPGNMSSNCLICFTGQMCGNGAVDNTRHFTHDGRFTGKQKAQRERYARNPLTHGLMRQDFVHQQGGAVCHSARTTTRAYPRFLQLNLAVSGRLGARVIP